MNSPFSTNANRTFNITFTTSGTSDFLDLSTLPAWGDKCNFEKYNYWFLCGGFVSLEPLSATDDTLLEKTVCGISMPNLSQINSCANMRVAGQNIAGDYNNLVYICLLDDIDNNRLNELAHIKSMPVLLNDTVGQPFMTAPYPLEINFLTLNGTSFSQPTITDDLELMYIFSIYECAKQ
tara:strand:- start:812 stop:1348 length:537 start_codon:yes stop_codon:yes gene_type:complete